jgi:hypothetical protein
MPISLSSSTLSQLSSALLSDLASATLSGLGPVTFNGDCISGNYYLLFSEYIVEIYNQFLTGVSYLTECASYIVNIHNITISVDLANPFYNVQVATQNKYTGFAIYYDYARALNRHIILRSGFTTIDAYLENQNIKVDPVWQTISGQVGYPISSSNVY